MNRNEVTYGDYFEYSNTYLDENWIDYDRCKNDPFPPGAFGDFHLYLINRNRTNLIDKISNEGNK